MVLANTTLGPILGLALATGVDQFLGVPYGHAERFRAAEVRVAPYGQRPLPALKFGPACLQFLNNVSTYGDEYTCFVLNIWRPRNVSVGDNLPVLVYVPGGENAFGEAGPYNASELAAAQNSIVVGVNYRVGPFGFLAFADDVAGGNATGNWAQTDIQAALRWVRREIGAFGGDAKRTTLFGQSSGGGLVLLHAFMPSSRGLVQGLVAQSGTLAAQGPVAWLKNTHTIATACNCSGRGFKSIRLCLEATDAATIIQAQGVSCANPNVCLISTSWAPAIDGIALPGKPSELLAKGAINRPLSVVVGLNTNDTNLFVSGLTQGLTVKGKVLPVPAFAYKAFLRLLTLKKNGTYYDRLVALYPPHEGHPFYNHSDRIGWVLSDKALCAISRLARSFARSGAATYAYRHDHFFTSNTVCTAVPNYHAPALGAMHQDELDFVFGQPIFMDLGGVLPNCSVEGAPAYNPTCRDCVFNALELVYSKEVGRLWTNFASTGNPNARKGVVYEMEEEEEWPAVTVNGTVRNVLLRPSGAAVQRMGSEPVMGRPKSCALWDEIDGESGEDEAMMGTAEVREAIEAALRVSEI